MRIAVVNNFFPPRPGGSSHLADHLAREYAAAGHDVLVITATYHDAPLTETRDGFRIVRIPAWTLPKTRFAANFDIAFTISPSTRTKVYALLDEFAPDVIHQHGQFFDLTWITGAWARRRRVPTLLSIHTRLYSPNPLHNAIYAAGDVLLVKPMMWLHQPTLVVMDVLMDAYIKARYHGAYSGTVAIPVGIDSHHLRTGDAEAARRDLGLAGEDLMILSIGHVIPQRNRVPLIRALPAILARHPRAKVVIIGTVYHHECLQLATELGVRDAVLAPGAVPQARVPDYLAAAQVECHELDGQGFGTASLEALAVGTPVVAAIRPDNFLEIAIRDREHLYLSAMVSPTDGRADPDALAQVVNDILDDPGAAKDRIRDAAHALIEERFEIRAVATKHLETLAALVAQR
jgi:glycosyltransferase involved in cell wall biosynthesis